MLREAGSAWDTGEQSIDSRLPPRLTGCRPSSNYPRRVVPRSLSPALRAVATLLALILVTPSVLLLPAAPAAVATVPPEPVEPLEVTIERLTPGEIPTSGTIEVGGTVTNVDDETWTTINLYPLLGGEPMTTPAQLREARRTDPLAYVGDRVTTPGPYAVIDRLEPGQSATYSFTVARSRLEATARGVYWFGVHALGQDTAGRDSVADGRARTFLPLVEQSSGDDGAGDEGAGQDRPRRPDGADVTMPVPVALVVPLRRRILHEADGSLAEPEVWADELGSNGTLGRLVSMGAQADGAPITWLVDPALTVAAAQLAAGNPARSLSPTVDPDAESGADAGPVVLRSGTFVDGDAIHRGSGPVSIVDDGEQVLLVFGDDVSITPGPDLFVYLSPNGPGEDLGEFVSLGTLTADTGAQAYVLPDNIDDYRTVVIWCRAFSITFATAELT